MNEILIRKVVNVEVLIDIVTNKTFKFLSNKLFYSMII